VNSFEMLKAPLKDDEYFHNRAPYNRPPKWEKRQKINGYMLTQKQYDEAVRNGRIKS
jgi:hypothetical protein